MAFLERQQFLDQLDHYLRDAEAGNGRLVFVSGEAGIGKSSLIRHFTRVAGAVARVAIASCDAMSTPGPLGPLVHIGPALRLSNELLRPETTHEQLSHQIHTALRTSTRPTVLVGEDAHWADEATLNHLRSLGRRVGDLPALIIVTLRDDELGPSHPLRLVLGDLASELAIRRITLPRLSPTSVRAMASGHPIDVDALVALTGGNPFFVQEILSSGVTGLPATVRDAVLARAARLTTDARRLLDAAAVIGSPIDPGLLADVAGETTEDAIEECLAVGSLEHRDRTLTFRHELAREAILSSMSPVRALVLHRRVLAALESDPATRLDLARLAHHAEHADDHEAVITYAVAAALQAASLRAHRQAAAQWARALRFAEHLPQDRRAEMLERRSYECYLTGLIDDAVLAAERALDLRRQSGDRLRVGDDLRLLSRLYWSAGRNADAEQSASDALVALEALPPSAELAWAYSNLAQLRMLRQETAEAISWGDRAIALAEELDQPEILVHALNNVGTARLDVEDESGWALLERSLALARQHAFDDHIARALTNLAWPGIRQMKLAVAESYLADGIDYTTQHDLDSLGRYLIASRAVLRLRRGDWKGATDDVRSVIGLQGTTPLTRIICLTVLGQVQARRGEPDPTLLDEALGLAERTGELLRLGPARVARAEAAWLQGDATTTIAEAAPMLAEARRMHDRWLAGELALLLHLSGDRSVATDGLAKPFALQIQGDWRRAAACWRDLGCPLEEARALVAGDEGAVREAWTIFDRLGARPDAAMTSRRLRELGVTAIPRGLRSSTRANPASLTEREIEVLALIAEGKPNRTIADRLFLSPKTVAHHVSSILGKLDVPTRADAARRAAELAVFQDRQPPSPR